MKRRSRRAFLQDSLAIAATAAFVEPGSVFPGQVGAAESPPQLLRLGGPVFAGTDDPEALALAHRKLGYRAAYCPNVPLNDTDKIRAYADAFARHDVVIAEVGRWYNLLDPDVEKRRQNLQRVTDGLALAEAIGALCCVDIAGSYNPTTWYGPHPDNLSSKCFDAIVENARKIIDAVKPRRAKFAYEAMGWLLPDSADSYVKLLAAVDRDAFGVHLDPCNLVNCPEKFYHNTALLNDCFDKLGRWIVSCHAKDLTWDVEMNIHFREVIPGKGSLDYPTYLRRLAKLPQNPPLMLEHLTTPEDYTAAREHVFGVGRKAGLSFG
ncbi:MAG: TIM barrel protein [Verrucomicrobiota bacterium]|jgi:sugar phosphate isomerase/epimerase